MRECCVLGIVPCVRQACGGEIPAQVNQKVRSGGFQLSEPNRTRHQFGNRIEERAFISLIDQMSNRPHKQVVSY